MEMCHWYETKYKGERIYVGRYRRNLRKTETLGKALGSIGCFGKGRGSFGELERLIGMGTCLSSSRAIPSPRSPESPVPSPCMGFRPPPPLLPSATPPFHTLCHSPFSLPLALCDKTGSALCQAAPCLWWGLSGS